MGFHPVGKARHRLPDVVRPNGDRRRPLRGLHLRRVRTAGDTGRPERCSGWRDRGVRQELHRVRRDLPDRRSDRDEQRQPVRFVDLPPRIEPDRPRAFGDVRGNQPDEHHRVHHRGRHVGGSCVGRPHRRTPRLGSGFFCRRDSRLAVSHASHRPRLFGLDELRSRQPGSRSVEPGGRVRSVTDDHQGVVGRGRQAVRLQRVPRSALQFQPDRRRHQREHEDLSGCHRLRGIHGDGNDGRWIPTRISRLHRGRTERWQSGVDDQWRNRRSPRGRERDVHVPQHDRKFRFDQSAEDRGPGDVRRGG